MRPPPVRLGAIPWLFRAVLLTAAYFVVAKLGWRYAPIGPSISPVWPPTGVTSLWLAHVISSSGVVSAFGLWWAGDYLGALVATPVLLTWLGPSMARMDRRATLKLLALVGGAVLAAAVVFGNLVSPSFLQPAQYPYLLFPFVIGTALRFGPRGSILPTLTVRFLAVAHTVRGGGPFVMHSIPSTDVALLIYVGVLAITGLFMSPAVARRLKAEGALREAHGHLQAVINSSPLAI